MCTVVPNTDPNFHLKQLHTLRMTYLKTAMIAALITPEMGTVTNQAIKMLRKSRQSTAFLDRSQPTDTTEPTYGRKQSRKLVTEVPVAFC